MHDFLNYQHSKAVAWRTETRILVMQKSSETLTQIRCSE